MSQTILRVNGLKAWFSSPDGWQKAVDGIDIEIKAGETVALLGESGSGKSLSALSLLRLNPQPASQIVAGELQFCGQNLLALSEKAMRDIRGGDIAMVFQEPQSALNPVLTIGFQIDEILKKQGDLNQLERKKKAYQLLEEVGIPLAKERMQAYPHQLSGGMKQRVMIAMALASEPKLLIADEPTTALDVTIQAQILTLLQDLQKKRGMAILFITHDIAVAAQMADTVLVMQAGMIVERGSVDAVLYQPKHHYTQQLLAALPTRKKRYPKGDSTAHDNQKMDKATILTVRDLKVYFPLKKGLLRRTYQHVKAVDGISFTLYAGETLAVVGESGSGKTTLGKTILGLTTLTSGQIEPVAYRAKQGEDMRFPKKQVIFQDSASAMNPRMTVAEIIAEACPMSVELRSQQVLEKIEDLLQQVGLNPDWKWRYPHQFSGGQRQRICIARALAAEPDMIICDEPTSALDISVQAQILQLLRQLQQKIGLAYLLITHDIGVVELLADRIAVMQQGKLVEIGDAEKVLTSPQQPYTQQLFSAVPRLTTLSNQMEKING